MLKTAQLLSGFATILSLQDIRAAELPGELPRRENNGTRTELVVTEPESETHRLQKLGGKEIMAQALCDPRLSIVIMREQPLDQALREKLRASIEPNATFENDAASYFLSSLALSQLHVEKVLREGNSAQMPRTIYLLGATGGYQEIHFPTEHKDGELREAPVHEYPSFQGNGKLWLGFLQPVKDGSELENPERVKNFYAQLREKEVFSGDELYMVYGQTAAYRLTEQNSPEQRNLEIRVNADFLEDLIYLIHEVVPKRQFLMKSPNPAGPHSGKLQTELGKEMLQRILPPPPVTPGVELRLDGVLF